jgi:Xaa-Pro aminopeptidase
MLRVRKTPEEIRLMQKAADATSEALILTIRNTRPGMFEYQLEALFEKTLKDLGIRATAFPTIAASGAEAAVLHYTRNDRKLGKNDLCLMDCGGEYHGYAADISRTFPAGERFTGRQKDVYRIVEEARRECVALVGPGTRLRAIHEKSVAVLVRGLRELGILTGSEDAILERKSYALFYPHGVSHPLGLDAHDVFPGQYKKRARGSALRADIMLEPGMVVTVEPGLYFNRHLLSDPEVRARHSDTVNHARARSFFEVGGVRIEDDVAVASQGAKVLSRVPSSIDAVEALAGGC